MKKGISISVTILLTLSGCRVVEDVQKAAKDDYSSCVDRVKRDYPVPPGNINAQRQMIEVECEQKK